MKSKDAVLLEQAYKRVVLKEHMNMDIEIVAKQLQFQPTTKKKIIYQYVDSDIDMPPLTYTVSKEDKVLHTPLDNTSKPVKSGDVIMSGPSKENYSVDQAKVPKLYTNADGSALTIGKPICPEQTPRNVAEYNGKYSITFSPSWGGSMDLHPGDYLVKEGEGKYYRIAKKEYEVTYNTPGKMG